MSKKCKNLDSIKNQENLVAKEQIRKCSILGGKVAQIAKESQNQANIIAVISPKF